MLEKGRKGIYRDRELRSPLSQTPSDQKLSPQYKAEFSGNIFTQPWNLVINISEMILWLKCKQQAKMPDNNHRQKSFELELLSFRLETTSMLWCEIDQ